MNIFRYDIVVAAYPVFVYVSRAGRQVDSTCLLARETTYTNTGCAATTIL